VNASASLWAMAAKPLALGLNSMRARLPDVALGEACHLFERVGGPAIGLATINSVNDGVATLDVVSDHPLTRSCVLVPSGEPMQVMIAGDLLGCVLDWSGKPVARFSEPAIVFPAARVPVSGTSSSFLQRRPVGSLLATGVRSLDAFVPCGQGQRLGIFAPAGTGKTTLSTMLLDGAQADVKVVALIGERTREVSDLVERIAASAEASRIIVVQATSDKAASARQYAAQVAMAVSEYFSANGCSVLLVVDSVTRYARALRELALARGEAPARRGYPASVFEALPRLFERAGRSERGCITGYFTVLLEDEQDPDPIAEEVKSLLDGHIMLSRKLAQRGIYPAVDPLNSLSRCVSALHDPGQSALASDARRTLQLLAESQMLRDLGEYTAGSNPAWDRAIAAEEPLMSFLRQQEGAYSSPAETWEALDAIGIQ